VGIQLPEFESEDIEEEEEEEDEGDEVILEYKR
jgi:hypothetical protein